jgi:hypothetical protein
MKTQGPDAHSAEGEATGLVIEPALDPETIAVLAYYYWEAHGCPNDSPQEDWFRAEAELRSRLAAAATA